MPNPFYSGRTTYNRPANPNTGRTNNSSNQNLADIYKMLSTSNDPLRVFNNIVKNNPKMAPVLTLLNQGMPPEQIFNTMCQQRGIDPQEFIKSIKG